MKTDRASMLAKSCFHRVVLGGTPNQPQTGAAKQRIVCKADVSEACGSGRMGRTAALCESRLCKHACTICFHRVLLFFPSVRNRRPQTRLLCRLYAASQLLSEADWASRPIPLCENSSLQACLHDLFSQSATVPYFSQSILLFRSRRICRLLPGSGSLQMPAPVLQGARRR